MNKMIIAMCVLMLLAGKSGAQNADPIINTVAMPGSLVVTTIGQLEVDASNIGNSGIVQNSLRVTVTVGANATIRGISAGSSPVWTQSSLTAGNGNTIVLTNTGGGIASSDGATILLDIQGTVVAANNGITSSIGYIAGGNPLLAGNAESSTQGNGQLLNDVSTTSLSVINNPLPLHLRSFSGTARQCDALLSWTATEEGAGNYYIIERSTDGSSFTGVEKVAARNETGEANYSTRLAQPASKSYYRLKMYSGDGDASYSNTVMIGTQCNANTIAAYPNPASSRMTFTGLPGSGTIRIYNITGQQVLSAVSNGSTFIADLSDLPAGQYRAVITGAGQTAVTIPVTKTD